MQIRNFADAHKKLREYYHTPGSNTYTLDRMRALMRRLGDPQNTLRVVHVAGTSGKTSTAYYIASLLAQTGATVGLTVSPHVDEINERLQINGMPMSEADFCQALSEFFDVAAPDDLKPSYFELLIAFVYWELARRRVDYAVIEVGMGGLLDGTNVIDSADKVCVITDIGLDHTKVLGKTIAEIAAQKAGIIYPGNHVFMHTQGPEVMAAVQERCRSRHATLHVASGESDERLLFLPLFQQRNMHLAEAAARYVLQRDGSPLLTNTQIEHAAQVYIPARMEIVQRDAKTIVLDGAHNAQKMEALVTSMQQKFPGQGIAALVSFVSSERERMQGALEPLAKLHPSVIATSFGGEQDNPKYSLEAKDIAAACTEAGIAEVAAEPDPAQAFAKLCERSEPILLVTGSLYLLNHIRPLLAEGQPK